MKLRAGLPSSRVLAQSSLLGELFRGVDLAGPASADMVREIVRDAGLTAASAVLEIGGGTAFLACELARDPGCSVVSTGTYDALLRIARARIRRAELAARIRVRKADPQKLPRPFRAGEFDAVLLPLTIERLDLGLEWRLRAAATLLRPGGVVALVEPIWTAPPPKALERLFELHGVPVGTIDDAFVALGDARYEAGVAWILPPEAWDAYYGPLQRRIARLRADGKADPLLDLLELEIGVFGASSGRNALGCAVLVARRPEDPEA